MAWPWLAALARHVPWGELVRQTPDIIAASTRLLDKSRNRHRPGEPSAASGPDPGQLEERIDQLEERDDEHARIIAQMVRQIQGLTEGLEVLAARNRLLMWVVGALVIALAAILALR
jgi:hypothetical protein